MRARGLYSCHKVINRKYYTKIFKKRDIEVLYTKSNRVVVIRLLQLGNYIILQKNYTNNCFKTNSY